LKKKGNDIGVKLYGLSDWHKGSRINPLVEIIKKYSDELNDFKIVLTVYDEQHSSGNKEYDKVFYSGPVFTVNYNKENVLNYGENFILIPDSYVLNKADYNKKISEVSKANNIDNFDSKIDKALFRGGANPGHWTKVNINTINDHPRLKIWLLSHLFPNDLDAKLVGGLPSAKSHNSAEAKIGQLYQDLMGDQNSAYVDLKEQLNYKYLISLDGYGSSWSRPETYAFSDSLLLYQTKWVQWFQPSLQPFKHYLPLKDDLSDLLERIQWAKNHPEEVKEIIKNQNEVANKCLTAKKTEEQLLYILKKYGTLYK
jgi:hypothetical protein